MTSDATSLSYSAGVQSHCLLEMVLRGHLERPRHFFVANADPGMEDERSYAFVAKARARCQEAGIEFLTATTPRLNLYQQLILMGHGRDNLAKLGANYDGVAWPPEWSTEQREAWLKRTRMDHPAYFTRNRETGKKGMLNQKCTREFKIRPMRRVVRDYLRRHFPTQKRPLPRVDTWIGFAADEAHRIKPKHERPNFYIRSRYPLLEMGMDRAKVEGYYLKHNIEKPPRSVCVACFANGLAHFEDMFFHRPDDWEKAVAVDDAIRDLTRVGVRDECFVSATLVPLRDLPDKNFLKGTKEGKEHRCNNGVCFL